MVSLTAVVDTVAVSVNRLNKGILTGTEVARFIPLKAETSLKELSTHGKKISWITLLVCTQSDCHTLLNWPTQVCAC